ncbi:MAG: protein-L-isoaspartate O-methyltransferase [Rhodospirillaceae bacterium]|nr:protein-L-isoaspartate O-methyltransferase [Rhodospirillaceae bacterium]
MDFAAARRKMVASQIRTSEVTDPAVVEAMGAVPRELFVPAAARAFAYIDEDIALGKGRYLIESVVLARLLQLADLQTTDKALIVGAGTGYSAAVMSRLVASVTALESDAALADLAKQALAQVAPQVSVVIGDLKAGAPRNSPYDVILVDGAVSALPNGLKPQLADGGRLVCIVREGPVGRATLVTRSGDSYGARQEFDAMTPILPGFEKQPKFVF